MEALFGNVLKMWLPLYCDGDDRTSHLHQSTKVCVINGENINVHKL